MQRVEYGRILYDLPDLPPPTHHRNKFSFQGVRSPVTSSEVYLNFQDLKRLWWGRYQVQYVEQVPGGIKIPFSKLCPGDFVLPLCVSANDFNGSF